MSIIGRPRKHAFDKSAMWGVFAGAVRPVDRLNVWQWAARHVDFGLNPQYPTEFKQRYDPDFLPFWKEPAECLTDPAVREVAILKCSQAGGTENVLLNPIRYFVACAPRRVLYVTGDQQAAESDFRERVKGGLLCSKQTARRMKQARDVELRLDFPDMTVAVAWPKNKFAFKRNPWSVIFVDEFSCYPDMTPGMIRKRCDTVPFSHIAWLSSPDPQQKRPSEDDPIFIEFWAGDQREWFCVDPKTGGRFRFRMGSPDTKDGLKWDSDAKDANGQWDMNRVRASAHYVTPDGTRIDAAQRLAVVKTGKWIAQNAKAPAWRRSYHVSSFMLPWKSGDFGEMACAFLDAKAAGPNQLKVFVYEYLAEPWQERERRTENEVIGKREGPYRRGELFTQAEFTRPIYGAADKDHAVFVTVDVQKTHLWYVVREWVTPGHSALVDFGHCVLWEEIDVVAERYGAQNVYVDMGYAERRQEVREQAYQRTYIPVLGEANLPKYCDSKAKVIPLYEGTESQKDGDKIGIIMARPDTYKSVLLDLQAGESDRQWFVYKHIELEYVRQVTSEKCVEGKWIIKKGHPANHLWDCEWMQLLAASLNGLFTSQFIRNEPVE